MPVLKHVLSVLILAGPEAALGDQTLTVNGHDIMITGDGFEDTTLSVDGTVVHQDAQIFLDPEPQDLGGLTVVTGAAGAGGNACNAVPFVIALPEGAAAEFDGPIDSCAYLLPSVEAETLVFKSDPLPGTPGETWVWTPGKGFAPGAAVDFAASAGWEAFDSLAGAHPSDALALAPVLEALKAGLGPQYPVFAERISDLGSGDLTAEGYLGRACLKASCEADWALLYLARASRQVFAAWASTGETAPHLWPADRSLWPAEALAALGG